MNPKYLKFRFYSKSGATAGLVMETIKFKQTSVTDLSRLFPMSEARFMTNLQISPVFDTWQEAFSFNF